MAQFITQLVQINLAKQIVHCLSAHLDDYFLSVCILKLVIVFRDSAQ